MSEKMGWEERIKDITTAYFVGLNLAVPPFNGKHSQEFLSQLNNLNQEKIRRARLDLVRKLEEDTKFLLLITGENDHNVHLFEEFVSLSV